MTPRPGLGCGGICPLALYWAAPWEFPTLDSQSRHYIQKRLGVPITTPAPQAPCDAATYLQLADDLRTRFAEEDYPVHSFPELSLASWQFKDATPAPQEDEVAPDMPDDDSGDELAAEVVQSQAPSFPSSPTSRVTAASCRSQSLSSYWTGCAQEESDPARPPAPARHGWPSDWPLP